jgi:hypothetical protein
MSSTVLSRFHTTTRKAVRDVLRNKKGFFAESLRERFFTPAVRSLRKSDIKNACTPSFRIRASDISARSCGLEMQGPSLCVPLTPRSLDEVFSTDLTGADCVEVRLDYLTNPRTPQRPADRLPIPVIATCRGKERGVQFEGSLEKKSKFFSTPETGGSSTSLYRFARPFPARKSSRRCTI